MYTLTPITWRDVLDNDPPEDGFNQYMARVPRLWLLDIISKMANTAYNSGLFYANPQQQIDFIMTFRRELSYAERIARLVAARPGSILLHPDDGAALARYALLFGYSNAEPLPYDAIDRLMRCMLLFNQRYIDKHQTGSSEPIPSQFLKYELRSALSREDNHSFVLSRYWQFLEWVSAQPSTRHNLLPVEADLQRFFGFDYIDYAAAAFAIITRFVGNLKLKDWKQQVATLSRGAYLSTLSDPDKVFDWIISFSLTIEKAQTELSKLPDTYSLADLRPFLDRPLLQINEEEYICPHQGFLRNTLGVGLYFTLFDRYKKDGENKEERFASLFGDFLEQYSLQKISECVHLVPGIDVYSAKSYYVGKERRDSTDIVLVRGTTAVFIEVTRKRFQMVKTLCDMDPDSLDHDLEGMVFGKAKQLDRSIADFKLRHYTLGDVNPDTISQIHPIILTEQGIPRYIALYDYIGKTIAERGYFRDVHELLTVSIGEIEVLAFALGGNCDLMDILEKKAASPETSRMSLTAYLLAKDRDIFRVRPGDPVDTGYAKFQDAVRARLNSWGLNAVVPGPAVAGGRNLMDDSEVD